MAKKNTTKRAPVKSTKGAKAKKVAKQTKK
jgi:hypothetical protein